MSYEEILTSTEGHVRTITLNRPERLNAWTPTLQDELKHALREAAADSAVRAIVLTGAGAGFCAGAEMGHLSNAVDIAKEIDRENRAAPGDIEANYELGLSFMLRVPKPIFAAINGATAGFGASLAIFADYRYISEDAKFTTVFARRGLIAEHGIALMLQRQIGLMNALDLLMTARVVRGREAAGLGLARLLPAANFLESVQGIAAEFAASASPRSAGVIKRQVYDGLFHDLAAAQRFALTEQDKAFACEDFREGIAHFVEKRPPAFTGQ